jgi:hypothetical protein
VESVSVRVERVLTLGAALSVHRSLRVGAIDTVCVPVAALDASAEIDARGEDETLTEPQGEGADVLVGALGDGTLLAVEHALDLALWDSLTRADAVAIATDGVGRLLAFEEPVAAPVGVGGGVGVALGECVAVGDGDCDGDLDGVPLGEKPDDTVGVGVKVGVPDGERVSEGVPVGERVSDGVRVGVPVFDGVLVGVSVPLRVPVGEGVPGRVSVGEGDDVGVFVRDCVGEGVIDGVGVTELLKESAAQSDSPGGW